MVIQWNQDVELELVNDFDEATETWDTSNEIFKKGEEVNVDIFDETEKFGSIQFGSGSVAFNVPKELFQKRS
jgi:hypothetical protein